MLTMQDYERMFSEDVDTMRVRARAFKDAVNKLKEIHHNARITHNNPQTTVEEFANAVGFMEARGVIASIVNARAKWDGRISPRNAEWSEVFAVWDRDVILRMGCYADDVIHSAHLDQLCDYMRRKDV